MTDAEPTGDGLGKKATGMMRAELPKLLVAFGQYAAAKATDRVGGITDRLADVKDHADEPVKAAAAAGAESLAEGESPAKATAKAGVAGIGAKLKETFGMGGGGKSGNGKKLKVTNIVETTDVGVGVRVAYNQWTQFADFPSFMKKVESVEQESDEKLTFKAKVFWSHRTWEATIVEQIPDKRIVWRSKGVKGHVDGVVSFHELAPDLTRILLVLEYHPQGLFEKTGNLWRAQGRRARLEYKHFVRHLMTRTLTEQEEIEGWRGEIRDGEVVKDHEEALAEEDQRRAELDQEPDEEQEEDRTAEPDQEPEAVEEEPGERPDRRPARAEGRPRNAGPRRPARRESRAGATR